MARHVAYRFAREEIEMDPNPGQQQGYGQQPYYGQPQQGYGQPTTQQLNQQQYYQGQPYQQPYNPYYGR